MPCDEANWNKKTHCINSKEKKELMMMMMMTTRIFKIELVSDQKVF